MRYLRLLSLVILVLACVASAKADPKYAGSATPLPGVSDVKIDVLESQPVQFVLQARIPMPTPGWELKVDQVKYDEKACIVRVNLTGKGPRGMVAQVITPTPVKIKLGTLVKGRPIVDIHVRRGAGSPYQRAGTVVLLAG